MPIDWNLANGQSGHDNALAQGLALGDIVRENRDRREMRKALAAYAANPEDAQAAAEIFQRNPELGAKLMDRAEDIAFRRDMGDYFTNDGGNALAGYGQGMGPALTPNALTPIQPGAHFDSAFAPYQQGAQVAEVPTEEQQIDLSSLGEPKTDRDRAFIRMLKRNPEKALKIRSDLRDNFIEQMKAEHDFYSIAADQLTRVDDEQSWQTMLADMERRAQALGFTLQGKVPDRYPGPEGVKALLEKAMPAKERMAYLLREANIEADNARSDRNTDSLIDTREARLDEYRRHNRTTEGNTRRGQDIRAKTSRRGQDLRGSAGRGGSGSTNNAPTATGKNGEKYVLRGGKWVQVN